MEANASMQRAFYLRLVMINPLHADLPSLAVFAHGVCNRFKSNFIRESYRLIDELVQQHISPHLGVHVGHASDGDARRFSNQLARMSTVPEGRLKYALDVEGFTLAANWDGTNPLTVSCIDSQDPRHNLAKLYAHSASSARVLRLGDFVATHAHVALVVRAAAARGQDRRLLPRPVPSNLGLDKEERYLFCLQAKGTATPGRPRTDVWGLSRHDDGDENSC
jgi:hypothetical protein